MLMEAEKSKKCCYFAEAQESVSLASVPLPLMDILCHPVQPGGGLTFWTPSSRSGNQISSSG